MDDPLSTWLPVQLLLFALYTFFTALEAGISDIDEGKLDILFAHDAKTRERMQALCDSEDTLSALRVLRTFCALFFGALAALRFANGPLRWLWLILSCIVSAFLLLVLARTPAKRLARRRNEKFIAACAPFIRLLVFILKPFILLGRIISGLILRAFGIDPRKSEDEVTEEEIRAMVDQGEESGAIGTNEREMIENVFEFSNTTADDVMTHRTDVEGVWLEDSDDEIMDTIRRTGLSRFPVYDEDMDDVVGILSTRDYLMNTRLPSPKPLRDILREAYFVPETVRTDVLFRNMQKQKNHIAVVVDEYGGMSGIVTMEDLLEEIVGNIYDEFDPAEDSDIERVSDNTWRVTGTVDLDTLSETLGVPLPGGDDYDTLGGLVFNCFTTIPQDGTTPEVTVNCTEDGEEDPADPCTKLHIAVTKIEEHRVESALVTVLPPDGEHSA